MWTDLEGTHERLINTHHCSSVVKLSTVVRSREQCHQLTLGKELIAILYHLSITQTTHTLTLNHLSIKTVNCHQQHIAMLCHITCQHQHHHCNSHADLRVTLSQQMLWGHSTENTVAHLQLQLIEGFFLENIYH